MFTLVQGAWALLLGRYSATDDIAFGTTVSVRPHELPDIESAAGLFINTIPVRVRLPADADLLSWFKELQLDAVEAREHQHSSLLDIQRWSECRKGRRCLKAFLFLRTTRPMARAISGSSQPQRPTDKLNSFKDQLRAHLACVSRRRTATEPGYDSDRFNTATTARMLGHLQTILTELVADPARKLAELPFVDDF